MFESICVVGERGQITLPKVIRKLKGISGSDKVVVSLRNENIVVEKLKSKKATEALFKEYYKKYSTREKELCKEWDSVSKEADAMLDDY